MTDNNHLDLSAVRESNEYWFEDIDTSCPFCNRDCDMCGGTGEFDMGIDSDEITECANCGGTGQIDPDNCKVCEGESNFDILWDTAFLIPYLKLGFEESKKLAWSNGWLLFEYDNETWIAAGSCGYDFTWVKANVALKLCGDLPAYYAEQLSSGGHVFVSNEDRATLASAAMVSIQHHINRLQYDLANMGKIAKYGSKEISDYYIYDQQTKQIEKTLEIQHKRNTRITK